MLQELQEIGLTQYEAKTYETLLAYGTLSGGQVAKKSTVPHGKTYVALSSLEEKGFVSITPTKPKLFSAIKPSIAIPSTIEKQTTKLERLKQRAVAKAKQVTRKNLKKPVEDSVTILKGKKHVQAILAYSFKQAKQYIKETRTLEYTPIMIQELERLARNRGVMHKIIATKKGAKELSLMKQYMKQGVKVKFYPLEQMRVHVVDGILTQQHIVNPTNSDDRMVLYAENKEFAQAMEAFFDNIWKEAKTITEKTTLLNL